MNNLGFAILVIVKGVLLLLIVTVFRKAVSVCDYDSPIAHHTAVSRETILSIYFLVLYSTKRQFLLLLFQSLKGIKTRHDNLDFVIIREQTEGEYSALEHETVPGVVESLKIVTKPKCLRIAKFAFDYATRHHREKVSYSNDNCKFLALSIKTFDGSIDAHPRFWSRGGG